MKRRLLNLLVLLSLLLCMAVVALWVRCYFAADGVGVGQTIMVSTGGRLCLAVPYGAMPYAHGKLFRVIGDRERLALGLLLFGRQPGVQWEAAGFEYRDAAVTGGGLRLYALPWWVIALGFAVAPAWRGLRTWRRRHLLRPALCPSCGYDLRATPDRCPECGTAATTPA